MITLKILLKAFGEALLVGLIALVLLTPITGLLLDSYSLNYQLQRPLLLAAIVAVGRFMVLLFIHSHVGQWFRQRAHRRDLARPQAGIVRRHARLLLTIVILSGLILPFTLSNYWLGVLILALIYVLLGLGLDIVVGLAGLLNLGYAAFYAVGAYTLALGAQYLHLSFWTALPLGGVIAAVFGTLLAFPILRMNGDYLAIVTLGFAEIIRLVLNNWMELTKGPNGMAVPFPHLFGLEFTRTAKQGGIPFHEYFGIAYSSNYRYIFTYLILFMVVCLIVWMINRLKNMPLGRVWEALREDEIACRSLGINPVTVKLSAFSISALVGGIAGVFFATFQGFVNPSSFSFFESALVLAIVVLGGMGSTLGVILAALVLTLLPEVLRQFADYRLLIFGVLMVVMMIWRPRGLVRVQRRVFE
jgi:branched-chain amino acid transport system permease protein